MIRRVAPNHEDVALLLSRLAEHNLTTYGEQGLSDAPPREWLSALVAYESGRPVGMIAIRSLDGSAHLLRLYIEPDARGRGLTSRLAGRAVEEARAAGFATAVWDTSTETPTAVAVSMAMGARPVPGFGPHSDNPDTRCFELPLAAPCSADSGTWVASGMGGRRVIALWAAGIGVRWYAWRALATQRRLEGQAEKLAKHIEASRRLLSR